MVDEDSDDYEALPDTSPLSQHMLAGACAGVMEHIVMYPVDSVKTRMQCLRPVGGGNHPGLLTGLYRLVLQEGISRTLKGSGAVIWGAGPAHAAYFGCYEKMKSYLATAPVGSTHVNHMIAGACATLLHDAVMTPADAVKQRLQIYNSPYHNTLDCLRRVCLTEGPSALYRAYFTQLSMNIPYQTIHFVCYEHAQSVLNPNRQYLPWTHVLSGGIAGCFAAAFTNPLDVCKTLLNTQIGQREYLAMTLGSLAVGVCCILETRILDSSEVLRTSFSSTSSKSMSHVRLSGDPVALGNWRRWCRYPCLIGR
ncbi:unnamed protein product [Heterobilharzia americana]|nr:unnamed protein product [Heterobilharzia americana]